MNKIAAQYTRYPGEQRATQVFFSSNSALDFLPPDLLHHFSRPSLGSSLATLSFHITSQYQSSESGSVSTVQCTPQTQNIRETVLLKLSSCRYGKFSQRPAIIMHFGGNRTSPENFACSSGSEINCVGGSSPWTAINGMKTNLQLMSAAHNGLHLPSRDAKPFHLPFSIDAILGTNTSPVRPYISHQISCWKSLSSL